MIIGTYIRRLYFNAETGQTAFLFRTDTNKCMKVVGKYCLQQEGFPLAIDGTFKNTEYGMFRNSGNLKRIYVGDKWNIENKSSEFIFLYCGTNFFMRMSAMHNLKAAGL